MERKKTDHYLQERFCLSPHGSIYISVWTDKKLDLMHFSAENRSFQFALIVRPIFGRAKNRICNQFKLFCFANA